MTADEQLLKPESILHGISSYIKSGPVQPGFFFLIRKAQNPTGRRRRRAPEGERAKGVAAFVGETRRNADPAHTTSGLASFRYSFYAVYLSG